MIVDCHIHLFQDRVISDRSRFVHQDAAFRTLYSSSKSRLATTSQIIEYMDEFSISRSVVFGFPWSDSELFRENNDAIMEFASKYGDRIIPFATFGLDNPDKALAETERIVKNGFRGLGELSAYESGWDSKSLQTLRDCVSLVSSGDKPVMIHVNEPVGHHYPGKIYTDFDGILKIIGQFQNVDFILAHFGGGVFFYTLMPEIGALLKRAYVDTAACPYIYDSRIYDISVSLVGENNILFGSDYPLLRYDRYALQMDKSSLTTAQKEKIRGSNAVQLFKL